MPPKKAPAKKKSAKKANEFGPFDEYTVVKNEHGSFGVPAGKVLVLDVKTVDGPGRTNTEITTSFK